MSRSTALSNKLVTNKYLWMAHQLRHFNDVVSIINWSNAMTLVKGLLLEQLPAAPTPINSILSSVPHPPSQPFLSISSPHISPINIPPVPPRNHDARSITPPTTIFFKPIKKMPPTTTGFLPIRTKPLTLSPARSSSYKPIKPSQLTISTHCQQELSPSNSLTQCPKRRKLTSPPSVDYYASTQSLAPGTHIWHGFFLHQTKVKPTWAFHKFNGSEEYKILQEIQDSKHSFIVKQLTTGKEFTVLLPDTNRLRS